MEKAAEENFVKNFVEKKKQERILYELGSKKKRAEGILSIPKFLKEDKVFALGAIDDQKLKETLLRYVDDHAPVYVLNDGEMDGQTVSFQSVFEKMTKQGNTFIVILDESTAFVKCEYEFGTPLQYLLRC